MMLVNKNILIISSERWDHIFVSKHHYAVHLAKRGNKVFFLNPPGRKKEVTITRFPGVYEINYEGFPPGLRFYPGTLQRHIFFQVFRMLEKLCSTQFEVVWSFDNSVFFDFSAIPSGVLKISHTVDLNQDFEVKRAASTADFCFCTSESLKRTLSRYNGAVYKINHGFHLPVSVPAFKSQPVKGRIRAVYAGNLSIPYIDWPLLLKVVQQHSHVDFHFVGPNGYAFGNSIFGLAKRKVIESENAVLKGRVKVDELAELYQSADVLLVAYQKDRHHEQVANPHKMMEYLGSGKVIIATNTLEYLDLYPLIVMSDKSSEWPHLFSSVISDLEYFNSQALQSERKAFAQNNSYENQILKIEQIINNR